MFLLNNYIHVLANSISVLVKLIVLLFIIKAGADLAFHWLAGGGVKLDKGIFHCKGVEAPPWNFFIFKGFLLQSKAYWTLFFPQDITISIWKPLNKTMISFQLTPPPSKPHPIPHPLIGPVPEKLICMELWIEINSFFQIKLSIIINLIRTQIRKTLLGHADVTPPE